MTERSRSTATPEELAASLLASARLDEEPMPEVVRHGMLAALGAAGAVGSASVVATAGSDALRRLALVKWLAATAVVGTAGFGALAVTRAVHVSSTAHAGDTAQPARDKLAPVLAPSTDTNVTAAAPAPETHANGDTSPTEPLLLPRRAASGAMSADKVAPVDASSLEGEVAALDRARSALAAGDASGALSQLGAYEQTFPKGALRPEATYLRIQALTKAGKLAAARDLAAKVLAKNPTSPHAAQLRALLSP